MQLQTDNNSFNVHFWSKVERSPCCSKTPFCCSRAVNGSTTLIVCWIVCCVIYAFLAAAFFPQPKPKTTQQPPLLLEEVQAEQAASKQAAMQAHFRAQMQALPPDVQVQIQQELLHVGTQVKAPWQSGNFWYPATIEGYTLHTESSNSWQIYYNLHYPEGNEHKSTVQRARIQTSGCNTDAHGCLTWSLMCTDPCIT